MISISQLVGAVLGGVLAGTLMLTAAFVYQEVTWRLRGRPHAGRDPLPINRYWKRPR